MPDPVVITRPRAQADALADAVLALGREAVLLPLLEIHPLADQSGLQGVLAGLADYAMVAFVSPNAIDAAFAHIAQWPDGVALAVLGEASRACLARHGIDDGNATIFSPPGPARSDSEHLLQSLALDTLAGRRVLIVRGESGRELMVDGLRAAGADVTTVAAYRRQVPAMTPELGATLRRLLARRNDWIITSSEALRGLLGLVAQLDGGASVAKMQQQHVIVPHARIAETAVSLGLTRLTLAGSGDASLLAALQSSA
ncbi:MAG: Uroporphyrinogen synthase [Massilia sp.]|jgi:uroporphyrinogen-III synthase|nr:Uroporphyrinogen synthase [Massilia sp.]